MPKGVYEHHEKGRIITWGEKISKARLGHSVSQETRNKIRESVLRNPKSFKIGRVPYNKGLPAEMQPRYGTHPSPESIRKMSEVCPHGIIGIKKCKVCEREWWHNFYLKVKADPIKNLKLLKGERLRAQARRLKVRVKVLGYYSNNTFHCAECGYDDVRALSIDHINGGGNKHRKEIGTGDLYSWLKRNNFPEGFRVLCMNCQFLTGHPERQKLSDYLKEKRGEIQNAE